MSATRVTGVFTSLAAVLLTGCLSLGPRSVERDRFDYNSAISTSWKEQTLLNIVKIRYADMPMFVEVASVVAGYTLESQLSAGASFPDEDTFGGDTFTVGASGRFTDRPTITYVPITGQQFNRSFMTPITPSAVLFLLQSGWAVDVILPVIVDSINGLRSQVMAGPRARSGDDSYYQVVSLLGQIQRSGGVGMQITRQGELESTLLVFHQEGLAPETSAALADLKRLLKIRPDAREIAVTYGSVPKSDVELAMLTRSMLQIMINLATLVEVPAEHAEEGRTPASATVDEDRAGDPVIRIRFSRSYPDSAFVAVRYRDHWFYIDDGDFASKRTFAFLMILFSLTETGGKEGLPLVTIPSS